MAVEHREKAHSVVEVGVRDVGVLLQRVRTEKEGFQKVPRNKSEIACSGDLPC